MRIYFMIIMFVSLFIGQATKNEKCKYRNVNNLATV